MIFFFTLKFFRISFLSYTQMTNQKLILMLETLIAHVKTDAIYYVLSV